jgi:hypothetical protein
MLSLSSNAFWTLSSSGTCLRRGARRHLGRTILPIIEVRPRTHHRARRAAAAVDSWTARRGPVRANESRLVGALRHIGSLTQGVASLALGFRISPHLGLARRLRRQRGERSKSRVERRQRVTCSFIPSRSAFPFERSFVRSMGRSEPVPFFKRLLIRGTAHGSAQKFKNLLGGLVVG